MAIAVEMARAKRTGRRFIDDSLLYLDPDFGGELLPIASIICLTERQGKWSWEADMWR
jgi:hypothetical protein